MFLRRVLPEDHLNADSKSTVNLGIGLIGTISGIALGLLVASAAGKYNTQKNELTKLSADFVLLDRVLAHYGSETKESRGLHYLTLLLSSLSLNAWTDSEDFGGRLAKASHESSLTEPGSHPFHLKLKASETRHVTSRSVLHVSPFSGPNSKLGYGADAADNSRQIRSTN